MRKKDTHAHSFLYTYIYGDDDDDNNRCMLGAMITLVNREKKKSVMYSSLEIRRG